MATALQIPFGRRPDGRLVEVSQVERGLACNCICPGCGERLLAKKGAVNVQHFAHLSGSDCATGAETALHVAAKQLVADKRWLRLPSLEVRATRTDPECGLFDVRKVFGRNETWSFDRVELELALGAVRPDAIGYIGSASHGVEILVTHQVEADKQAYLAGLALPCIEIDLSEVVGKVFTFEDLEAVVLASVENKRWLFHPRQAEWEASLLAGFEAWRQARLAELARQKERLARPASPRPSQTDVYRAANEKYRALSPKEKWARLERQLGVPRKDFPSHVRVALHEGGDVILADNELWQGAVFAQFILGTTTDDKLGKRMPNERALSSWLSQRFGCKGDADAARTPARAYLNYLRACGFLRRQGFDLYVAHSELTAPRREPSPSTPELAPPPPLASASIQWRNTWPDRERLVLWAAEASKSGQGFAADWFVEWLLTLDEPPSFDDVREAFAAAHGNPREVLGALRSMGVVANTWRYFSYGEAAPWLAG